MITTERLYYDDPFLIAFRGRVLAASDEGGRPHVILDRTAFYPEAGGQMADRGELGGKQVLDVQVGDDGALRHWIEGPLPEVGTELEGRVDWGRRRVHMALHTGQQILSRALLDVARAETVSARLGETACTIDVDAGAIEERDIARAEDLANAIIDDDVSILSYFPDPKALAALPLRRQPKVSDNVRIVQIGEFDWTPCGGTHCRQSAQVGLIHIASVERYKGGTRVTFGAGRRARDQLVTDSVMLRSLALELSSGVRDVPAAIDRLKRDLTAARESLGLSRAELAVRIADEMLLRAKHAGETTIIEFMGDASVDLLRAVAKRVTEVPDVVLLLAGREADGLAVIVTRAANGTFDCGAFLKRAAASCGGRGGGRPERAEGRVPGAVDWVTFARSALTNG